MINTVVGRLDRTQQKLGEKWRYEVFEMYPGGWWTSFRMLTPKWVPRKGDTAWG
jgi:hypothetical protein